MKTLTKEDFDLIITNMNAAKKFFREEARNRQDIGYLDDPKTLDVFMMVAGVYGLIADQSVKDIAKKEQEQVKNAIITPVIKKASAPTDEEIASAFNKPTKREVIAEAMEQALSINRDAALYKIKKLESSGKLIRIGGGKYQWYEVVAKPDEKRDEEVEEYTGPVPDFEGAANSVLDRIQGASV